MSMEADLLARIPAGASEGRARVVHNTIAALLEVKGKVAEAGKNVDVTALGRAKLLQPYAKTTAVPALLKAKRQLAHGQLLLDGQRAALRKKAAGEPKATDAEWREVIRKMDPNNAAEFLLRNPAARGPALREPELAFIGKDVYEQAMRKEIQENHERAGAELVTAERAQELHRLAVVELEKSIVAMPILTSESSGEVHSFPSVIYFNQWIDRELPGASVKEILPIERAEIAA